MRSRLLLLLAAATLAGCALITPPGPYDAERFRDDPDAYGLVVMDVAAGALASWALVLRAQEGTGSEVIFRPPDGARPVKGVATIARALPPGSWRPVRVMAVQDGRPCAAGPDAPLTRAVYPAQLGERAEAFTLEAGDALYLGRLGITADLFACDGATLTLRATEGAPARAAARLKQPLEHRSLFPSKPVRLQAE